MAKLERDGGAGDLSGTVARVIGLMRALAETRGSVSIKALSATLDLPASTVHRLLRLLMRQGIVEHGDRYSYTLGSEFFRLGALVAGQARIGEIALPYMRAVVEACDEFCLLCLPLPAECSIMIVETVSSSHPLGYVRDKYSPLPMAWGATGRAILAFLPEQEIRACYERAGPSPADGRKLPSYSEFRRELKTIWRQGYAHTSGQKIPGAVGFGAPVFGAKGNVVASLCVTVPKIRYRAERRRAIATILLYQADQLSRALGYLKDQDVPHRLGVRA